MVKIKELINNKFIYMSSDKFKITEEGKDLSPQEGTDLSEAATAISTTLRTETAVVLEKPELTGEQKLQNIKRDFNALPITNPKTAVQVQHNWDTFLKSPEGNAILAAAIKMKNPRIFKNFIDPKADHKVRVIDLSPEKPETIKTAHSNDTSLEIKLPNGYFTNNPKVKFATQMASESDLTSVGIDQTGLWTAEEQVVELEGIEFDEKRPFHRVLISGRRG